MKQGPLSRANRESGAPTSAEHDAWFRGEVRKALDEADAPEALWIDHDRAASLWRRRREELSQQIRARRVISRSLSPARHISDVEKVIGESQANDFRLAHFAIKALSATVDIIAAAPIDIPPSAQTKS